MRFLTAFDSGVVASKLDILDVWDCARGVEVTVGGGIPCSVPAFYIAVQVVQALGLHFSAFRRAVKVPGTPERRKSCRDLN